MGWVTIRSSKATFFFHAPSLFPSIRRAPNLLQGLVIGKHKAAAVWQHFYPSPATVVGCHFPTQAELILNNSRALNGKQANTQSTTSTPKKPTRREAVTPSAAKGAAETHAKMLRERCSVPNMAESPSRCGHPGSGHWGVRRLPGRRRTLTRLREDAGLAERHKDKPSAIWQNPTFHPARQGRQIRQQNPSFEGPGRRRVFRAGAERQSPEAARCGARERSPPRAALCAGCQRWWRPETHFGAPAPPAGAASPAPPASARRREQERGPGTPHGWRPRPASPPPPGPPSWPRPPGAVLPTGAGPSPGAGPRQARPARRAPCVPVAGPLGEGGGGGPRPALGGTAVATSRSRPPPPGSHGVVAGVGTLRSGLAARRLKGVRSGGSRRRRCHRAAVAAAAGRA